MHKCTLLSNGFTFANILDIVMCTHCKTRGFIITYHISEHYLLLMHFKSNNFYHVSNSYDTDFLCDIKSGENRTVIGAFSSIFEEDWHSWQNCFPFVLKIRNYAKFWHVCFDNIFYHYEHNWWFTIIRAFFHRRNAVE